MSSVEVVSIIQDVVGNYDLRAPIQGRDFWAVSGLSGAHAAIPAPNAAADSTSASSTSSGLVLAVAAIGGIAALVVLIVLVLVYRRRQNNLVGTKSAIPIPPAYRVDGPAESGEDSTLAVRRASASSPSFSLSLSIINIHIYIYLLNIFNNPYAN